MYVDQSQIYELYAVVEHSGDLRGGHYRAVIKSKDEGDDWFVFDDRSVMKVKPIKAFFLLSKNFVQHSSCKNALKQKLKSYASFAFSFYQLGINPFPDNVNVVQ